MDAKSTTINDKTDKIMAGSLQTALQNTIKEAIFPNDTTVVTGALTAEDIVKVAEAGIEHVINLQPEDELTFNEQAEVEALSMHYTHVPIDGVAGLKQLNLLAFDKALRMYHGKKTLMHCSSGAIVGACVALRAGWLRGRKMDTAMKWGEEHGLQKELEEEVRMRLLVPR